MKQKLIILVAAFGLLSCQTLTPNETAILTTATNLARVAASAAATFYGGPAAGALASAGLDALGTVMQGYLHNTIPPEVVAASPGVAGVGPAIVSLVAPHHVVSQADINKVNLAAQIAAQAKNVVVIPKTVSNPGNAP